MGERVGIKYCGGGQILGRRIKQEGLDDDGSGGRIQTDADALEE